MEDGECWLSFSAEAFVFQFAIQKFKDYELQNYNFAVVLYGCETGSLPLREESGFRVFENRVLRRIFWPWKDEIAREW
jgi:hypothetical protein